MCDVIEYMIRSSETCLLVRECEESKREAREPREPRESRESLDLSFDPFHSQVGLQLCVLKLSPYTKPSGEQA